MFPQTGMDSPKQGINQKKKSEKQRVLSLQLSQYERVEEQSFHGKELTS